MPVIFTEKSFHLKTFFSVVFTMTPPIADRNAVLHYQEDDDGPMCVDRLGLQCCRVLSSDVWLLEYAISRLPAASCAYLLLKCALERGSYSCLQLLLHRWPSATLCLADLCDLKRKPRSMDEYTKNKKMAAALVHAFLRALESGHVGHLKLFDLRGVIVVEPVLSYLSTHVMLAHNESKRLQVIQAVRQFEHDHSGTQALSHNTNRIHDLMAEADTTLPPETDCTVLVDIRQTEYSARLQDALAVSQMQDAGTPRLRLILNQMTITLFSEEQVNDMVDAIDDQHLTGLSIVATQLDSLPAIARFHNLVTLDLHDTMPVDQLLIPSMADTLSKLPNLAHLGLTGNRLCNRLKAILDACQQSLRSLELPRCNLRALDLLHLSGSKHVHTLTFLDISSNDLGSCMAELCSLLRVCRRSLRLLLMDNCKFMDAHLERVLTNARLMPHLAHLSLADNDWFSCEHMCASLVAQILSKHSQHSIRKLRFSVPNECSLDWQHGIDLQGVNLLASYDVQDEQRRAFTGRVSASMCEQSKAGQPLSIELSEHSGGSSRMPGPANYAIDIVWTDPTGVWPDGMQVDIDTIGL